jgi:signal transduction histidine kinase
VGKRLGRGISQLASLALEAARLVEELEEANRLKADFLANMSHELRTPLNVIIGYNEMLADGAFGPLNEEQVSTIERVKRNAQEQLALVTTTLELSRFEARDAPLDIAEIDVAQFIDELAREAATLPRQSDLQLKWSVEPGVASLNSDQIKLRMVLKNLIDNALKFTERGSVVVQARSQDGGVEFRVADTGIGIAPEEQRRIFEPFQQSDDAKAQNRGGVGLGLHLVNRLVGALGGTSRVESKLGHGSTFFVWIPNSDADGAGTLLRESA